MKILSIAIVLAILAWVLTLNIAHAVQVDTVCLNGAADQVATEPGVGECMSHKPVSEDCKAVIRASMIKRIHECQEIRRQFHLPH